MTLKLIHAEPFSDDSAESARWHWRWFCLIFRSAFYDFLAFIPCRKPNKRLHALTEATIGNALLFSGFFMIAAQARRSRIKPNGRANIPRGKMTSSELFRWRKTKHNLELCASSESDGFSRVCENEQQQTKNQKQIFMNRVFHSFFACSPSVVARRCSPPHIHSCSSLFHSLLRLKAHI